MNKEKSPMTLVSYIFSSFVDNSNTNSINHALYDAGYLNILIVV